LPLRALLKISLPFVKTIDNPPINSSLNTIDILTQILTNSYVFCKSIYSKGVPLI